MNESRTLQCRQGFAGFDESSIATWTGLIPTTSSFIPSSSDLNPVGAGRTPANSITSDSKVQAGIPVGSGSIVQRMAAMAAAAGAALLGASSTSKACLSSSSRYAATQLKASNGSRVSCRTAFTIPKQREWLLAEAEKRWEAALEAPLAGVEFTHDEFADALSKYDFSFEVGDMVLTHSP